MDIWHVVAIAAAILGAWIYFGLLKDRIGSEKLDEFGLPIVEEPEEKDVPTYEFKLNKLPEYEALMASGKGDPRQIKMLIMMRAMEAIQVAQPFIQRRPELAQLAQVGRNQKEWENFVAAQEKLNGVMEQIKVDANDFQENWGETIFQEAHTIVMQNLRKQAEMQRMAQAQAAGKGKGKAAGPARPPATAASAEQAAKLQKQLLEEEERVKKGSKKDN